MNTAEQINAVIDNLASKLGVAADKLWPILLKQAYVDGIINIVGLCFGLSCLIVSLALIYRFFIAEIELASRTWNEIVEKTRGKRSAEWDEERVAIFCVCVGIAIAIGLIFAGVSVVNGVTCFINPEWYALQKILSELK